MSDQDREAASRREFLKKALRTGAYMAPVVMAMSMRNLSAAQASAPMMVVGMMAMP